MSTQFNHCDKKHILENCVHLSHLRFSSSTHLLGVFSFVEQLFGCAEVSWGLVDDPLDVSEIGEAVLYLPHHFVQSGPVNW